MKDLWRYIKWCDIEITVSLNPFAWIYMYAKKFDYENMNNSFAYCIRIFMFKIMVIIDKGPKYDSI